MDDGLIDGRIDTTEDGLSAACWIPAGMDVPCRAESPDSNTPGRLELAYQVDIAPIDGWTD